MSLDYRDKRDITESVEEAQRETTQLLRESMKQSKADSKQTADAFNRVAAALEKLTGEVRLLRADMNPVLDKTKKLPLPATGVTTP